jgi:hypothetical protein
VPDVSKGKSSLSFELMSPWSLDQTKTKKRNSKAHANSMTAEGHNGREGRGVPWLGEDINAHTAFDERLAEPLHFVKRMLRQKPQTWPGCAQGIQMTTY